MAVKNFVFYEIGANCPSVPEFDSAEEKVAFDSVNNAGALDAELLTMGTSPKVISNLLRKGYIERRTGVKRV